MGTVFQIIIGILIASVAAFVGAWITITCKFAKDEEEAKKKLLSLIGDVLFYLSPIFPAISLIYQATTTEPVTRMTIFIISINVAFFFYWVGVLGTKKNIEQVLQIMLKHLEITNKIVEGITSLGKKDKDEPEPPQ